MRHTTLGWVRKTGLFTLILVTTSQPTLRAQERPVVYANGIVHAASMIPPDFPGGPMAPGSLISFFGSHFHFGESVSASALPLPTQLGPLGTRVLVNGVFACRLLFVSEGQINCQLPDDLSGEQVRLRVVTSSGESSEATVPLRPMGFGMFAMNQNGRGPLVVSNVTNAPDPERRFQPNGPRNPAMPGQFVVLWGSGLGPTEPPVPTGEAPSGPAPAVQQPQVFIGDHPAMVQYAGRAPGFAGLDQINVLIPEDAPAGCAVPVRTQVGPHTSNVGTISVSPDGQPCRDPFEDIVSGSSHGSVLLNSGLGRLGPGQLGPMEGLSGPFPHDGDHGPGMGPGGMHPGDSHGPGMGFGGGVGSGPGGVGSDGIGPFGLHPGIHMHAGGQGLGLDGGLGPDVATARFVRLASESWMDVGIPPAASNSCNTHFQMPGEAIDMFHGPREFLDAGELTLTGPGVNLTLAARDAGPGVLYAGSLPTPLEMGTYSVSGSGGADVGRFGPAEVAVPALLDLTTSLEAGTQISHQNSLKLTWVGGNPDDLVLIHGRSFQIPEGTAMPLENPLRFRSQAFMCSTTAGQGRFTIPSYVLESLPEGLLVLNVTHMPGESGVSRFQAEGLDLGGVFRWVDTTTYLDLELVP